MIKIKDAVDGVIDAMRLRGCCDYTLKEIRWSVYTPIIRYHCDNGTEVCSDELLEEICRKQEESTLFVGIDISNNTVIVFAEGVMNLAPVVVMIGTVFIGD